jgi:hypothetical protein
MGWVKQELQIYLQLLHLSCIYTFGLVNTGNNAFPIIYLLASNIDCSSSNVRARYSLKLWVDI